MDSSDLYVGASVQAVFGVKKKNNHTYALQYTCTFACVARENQALTK